MYGIHVLKLHNILDLMVELLFTMCSSYLNVNSKCCLVIGIFMFSILQCRNAVFEAKAVYCKN